MTFLWPFIYAQRWRFAWGMFALLLTNLALILFPQLFRIAIELVENRGTADLIKEAAWLMVAIAGCGAVARTLSRIHIFYAARDIELDIRNDFYKHLARQGPRFYIERSAGDLMTHATSDLTQIRLLFGPALLNIASALFMYVAVLPFMWSMSPYLTLVSFGLFLPGLAVMSVASRRMYFETRQQQAALGELSNFIQEHLAGQEVVRSFTLEEVQNQRFETHNDTYNQRALQLAWSRSYLWKLVMLFAEAGIIGALVLGAVEVSRGELTLGQVIATVEYLVLLSWPSLALGWIIGLWQRGTAALDRITSVMNAVPEVQDGPIRDVERPELQFENASFGYENTAILSGIQLNIPFGNTLGIVGPIGSGKSTLVHALIRDLPTLEGQVLLGGHPLTDFRLECLRRQFGFVHQEPLLFSTSIRNNVQFGVPDATEEQVLQALHWACFDSDLSHMPQGLDTQVGERGVTLSGGQKQRIAIARALLLDPSILVLDDALSAVDAETETEILQTLHTIRRGKTNIVVAHRLSAVTAAASIIVLEKGGIKEQGTHQELVDLGGTYARLYTQQRVQQALSQTHTKAAAQRAPSAPSSQQRHS